MHPATKVSIALMVLSVAVMVAALIAGLFLASEDRLRSDSVFLVVFLTLTAMGVIALLIGQRGPEERRRRAEGRRVLDPTNDPSWPAVMTGAYRPIDKPDHISRSDESRGDS